MPPEKMNLNAPIWKTIEINRDFQNTTAPRATPQPIPTYQETWYLNLNHPIENRALSLKFSILISANGFRRTAEVTALYFDKAINKETLKIALRQRHEIDAFSFSDRDGIRIGECKLTEGRTTGRLQSKGHTLTWDFQLTPRPTTSLPHSSHYELIPAPLKRAGFVRNSVFTTDTDLIFTGTCELDGKPLHWDHCPGMQGHQNGSRNGHSWIWGHCNSFTDEQGVPTHFVFEGLSTRTQWLGAIPFPKVTTLFFQYQGKPYFFNSLRDALRLRSRNTLTEWNFQADRNDLSFRGRLSAQYKDFAGITLEDTNGSLIYCSNTQVAEITLFVYRSGKLEATLHSTGGAAFEIASREKNPYIPQLI